MPKAQPPELKKFMDRKLTSERALFVRLHSTQLCQLHVGGGHT